jgi:hypothetical protein
MLIALVFRICKADDHSTLSSCENRLLLSIDSFDSLAHLAHGILSVTWRKKLKSSHLSVCIVHVLYFYPPSLFVFCLAR